MARVSPKAPLELRCDGGSLPYVKFGSWYNSEVEEYTLLTHQLEIVCNYSFKRPDTFLNKQRPCPTE
jgi:hypothetical protein